MKRYQNTGADSARWGLYEPRRGDIIITTPPKAGTTLTQMLCALLVFDSTEFPAPMDDLSPWFDMLTRSDGEALAIISNQNHRRFIKTHTPIDGLPLFDEVTYVCVGRDPRDMLVSWEHHVANMDREALLTAISEAGTIEQVLPHMQQSHESLTSRVDAWLQNDSSNATMSLAVVANHLQQSWDHRTKDNVVLLHFEDLKADRAGAMQAMASAAGLEVAPARATELAAAAGLDQMRERAEELAPNTKGVFHDPAKFFRSGQGGEWEAYTTAEQRSVYAERVSELLSADLLDWLERPGAKI